MKKEPVRIAKMKLVLILVISSIVLISGCAEKTNEEPKQLPTEIPKGILVDALPENMDILFVSMRYVLNDPACLDENNHLRENFLNHPECNKKIYNAEANLLASPRQLYALDAESGEVIQLTNIECDFSSSKPVDATTIMTIGACEDTDNDGLYSTNDKVEIYLIKLAEKELECLTCGLNLTSINNPDYSIANKKIVFSAQNTGVFHHYLFTLDLDQNLKQITNSEDYMDFDSSWSEDGSKIVLSRLILQGFPLTIPSEIWLMDADGSNQERITSGGPNPNNEEPLGIYPIGIDADPDLSPDNEKVIFSRLKTGKENALFGVYELVIVDVYTKEVTILDSSYANMVPEWKSQGIIFIRQDGSSKSVMDLKQSIFVYKNNSFENLEPDPYDIFPIGSNGASWIE